MPFMKGFAPSLPAQKGWSMCVEAELQAPRCRVKENAAAPARSPSSPGISAQVKKKKKSVYMTYHGRRRRFRCHA